MSNEFSQIIGYLTERTPQARIARLRDYFGEVDPTINAQLAAVDAWLLNGGAGLKGLHMLTTLEKKREQMERKAPRASGGKATADARKQERQQRAAEAARLWDELTTIPKTGRAVVITERMNVKGMKVSVRTVRGYLRERKTAGR